MSNGYGAIPQPLRIRDYDYCICAQAAGSMTAATPPSEYMIPDKNMPSVQDQGQTSMCVAFATCGAAESYKKSIGLDEERQAPGYMYGSTECRGSYRGEGMYTATALKGVLKIGFVPFLYFDVLEDVPKIFDYTKDRPDLKEMGEKVRPSGFSSLNYADRNRKVLSAKTALMTEGRPLVVASHNYFGGSHCVLLVGWNDEQVINKRGDKKPCAIYHNSWGKTASMPGALGNGKGFIPWDELDEIYSLAWEPFTLPFADVQESDWFYDSVKECYYGGFMKGTMDNAFEPELPVIRADAAVAVSRMIKRIEVSANTFLKTLRSKGEAGKDISLIDKNPVTSYQDVKHSDYFAEAVYEMAQADLLYGTGDSNFEPMRQMTRAEIAALFSRTLRRVAQEIKKSTNKKEIVLNKVSIKPFSDLQEDAWYFDYVVDACVLGLMQGDDTGTFRPEETVTRAEFSAILQRLFKAVEAVLDQID